MIYNWLMLETAQAKELAVAEAVDRLVGVDSSYCPLYYEVHRVARYQRTRGKAVKANVVIPRYIFITASFPRLEAVLAIDGAIRFGLNNHFQPEVIPSWQMREFQECIDLIRLSALRQAANMERALKPEKPIVVKSFAELAAQYKLKAGEIVDPETGEILDRAAA